MEGFPIAYIPCGDGDVENPWGWEDDDDDDFDDDFDEEEDDDIWEGFDDEDGSFSPYYH